MRGSVLSLLLLALIVSATVPILTMFTGKGSSGGFSLSAQPRIPVYGPYDEPYSWQFNITATAIGTWTGQVDLSGSDDLPAAAAFVSFESATLNINSNTPSASTLLYVVIVVEHTLGITVPGMYTITVTGVDDATGTLTSSTTITIIIPAATGQTACVTCSIITQLQPISTFGTPSITQAFTIPSITQAFTTPSIIQAQVSPQTQPGTGDFFVNNAFLMIGAVAVAILLISAILGVYAISAAHRNRDRGLYD